MRPAFRYDMLNNVVEVRASVRVSLVSMAGSVNGALSLIGQDPPVPLGKQKLPRGQIGCCSLMYQLYCVNVYMSEENNTSRHLLSLHMQL